ncbi:MAG TPA: hypothetical protein PL091_05960 [Actinomycetota bacterium]|nr:hypothetical protein [Actinomycetota bacterium]
MRLTAVLIIATGLTGGLVRVTVAATATPTSVVQAAKKKHKLPTAPGPPLGRAFAAARAQR